MYDVSPVAIFSGCFLDFFLGFAVFFSLGVLRGLYHIPASQTGAALTLLMNTEQTMSALQKYTNACLETTSNHLYFEYSKNS